MLTSFLIVRHHPCQSVPNSTTPLPHFHISPLSSNSFPHNSLSDPHLLNPVVTILYKNSRGRGPVFGPRPLDVGTFRRSEESLQSAVALGQARRACGGDG